jgi:hypothetical protein
MVKGVRATAIAVVVWGLLLSSGAPAFALNDPHPTFKTQGVGTQISSGLPGWQVPSCRLAKAHSLTTCARLVLRH